MNDTLAQAFESALQHHLAGNLQQAEVLYRQILAIEPAHADALHLLGVIAHQVGKNDLAVEYISQVLRLNPEFAEAHHNLGLALAAQEKWEEAVTSYQRALRCRPDMINTHFHLGNAYEAQGKVAEAIACYQETVRQQPNHAVGHYSLGRLLQQQGQLSAALASYEEAVRCQPDLVEAHNNMGNIHNAQGKKARAIECYQQAVRLRPDNAEARYNLGLTLQKEGNLAEAIANYRQAVALKPDHAAAFNDLGNALQEQGEFAEAVASYRQALRVKPDFAEAYINMGHALKGQGKYAEAMASLYEALRANPDHPEAHISVGLILRGEGKHDEAIAAYRRAVMLKPDTSHFHDNLLFAMHYHPDYDTVAIYQEARRWQVRHAEPLARFHRPHTNSADSRRRLRVGYVSPDFGSHALAYVLIPLLANHDRRQVEIFCYAEVSAPDHMTERLRAHADEWRSTVGIHDEQVAEMVRQDQIDILVDLALHTSKNRLLVFARKPAPVQVTWLGYPGTTGMSAIDYRLTDPYLDPPGGGGDACYSEKSIRLPHSFWCYHPIGDATPIHVPPASANGFVTFGCLNNFCKVNDVLLSLWARVLQGVRGSRLLLHAPRGLARDHVRTLFEQEGVAAERVEFIDRLPGMEYLQVYGRIDICLDTWPCNGGVTSLDASWMGVPFITLVGKTVVGRAGWSLLNNLGLPELAARTPEEYVSRAVELAADLPRLEELRAGLRGRMCASPLMDGARFARDMEQLYREIWQKWCVK
jgi:predicted O-linked N-acetylglucosamine transferase (SPINDLY family)